MAPTDAKTGALNPGKNTPGKKDAKGDKHDPAHDPLRALAYHLRGSKQGPESRNARLDDYKRVDYFRGRDIFRLLRKNTALLDEYAPAITGKPTPPNAGIKERDVQITAIGERLMREGYIKRIDRVYDEPRPGRTRRVKFPSFMQTLPRQLQRFTDDGEGFYGWLYEQPTSWTTVVLSGLAAFVVVLMCLFPLAPIWMKKIVLYTCISILGVFFFIFVVRTAVFAVVWLLTGRHFWILPNITSDEIPIDEVFSPMWEFDDLDASGNVVGRINAVKRLGLAGALTAVLVGLYKIAPENTKAINIHKAHDSILDLFDLNDVPKGIAGSTASGAKLDPQDPANIARMDKMRREAGGAGSRVTVEDVDGVNGTSTENGENATEPTEPSYAKPPEPDKPIEEMTAEELEAWEAAVEIHRVAEDVRKKKEAEEAARAAAGEPTVQRIVPAKKTPLYPTAAAGEEAKKDPPPPSTPHPHDSETKKEL
jgi:translocation protein SEC62